MADALPRLAERVTIVVGQCQPEGYTASYASREDRKRREAYTNDELQRVLAMPWQFENKTHREAATLFLLLLWTGCRSNEVCEALATDTDGHWFTVAQGKNANARRRIPVHPVIRPLVVGLTALGNEFLMPGLVRGGARGGVNQKRNKATGDHLRDFIRKHGVGKTAHELRNTFAQRMAEHADMPGLKSLLGHSKNGDITMRYIGTLQPGALQRHMQALTFGETIDSACRVVATRLSVAWKYADD